MINKTIPIQVENSSKESRLVTYCYELTNHLLIQKRPLVLVCPGGGYSHLSDREGETLALQFNAMGYNAAVLYYSLSPVTYPTSLMELATAVKFLKEHSEEYHVDSNRIVVMGSSAGGHLASCFAMNWFKPIVTDALSVSAEYLKPAGLLLSYPVITSGEYAHRGSFDNLLMDSKDNEALLKEVSMELHVDSHTPPTFMWHTFTDGTVPVENSLMLGLAMKKANVPFELHIFPTGGHGLGLANEITLSPCGKEIDESCQSWISLAKLWLSRLLGPIIQ